jgi:hypothetical protein
MPACLCDVNDISCPGIIFFLALFLWVKFRPAACCPTPMRAPWPELPAPAGKATKASLNSVQRHRG